MRNLQKALLALTTCTLFAAMPGCQSEAPNANPVATPEPTSSPSSSSEPEEPASEPSSEPTSAPTPEPTPGFGYKLINPASTVLAINYPYLNDGIWAAAQGTGDTSSWVEIDGILEKDRHFIALRTWDKTSGSKTLHFKVDNGNWFTKTDSSCTNEQGCVFLIEFSDELEVKDTQQDKKLRVKNFFGVQHTREIKYHGTRPSRLID